MCGRVVLHLMVLATCPHYETRLVSHIVYSFNNIKESLSCLKWYMAHHKWRITFDILRDQNYKPTNSKWYIYNFTSCRQTEQTNVLKVLNSVISTHLTFLSRHVSHSHNRSRGVNISLKLPVITKFCGWHVSKGRVWYATFTSAAAAERHRSLVTCYKVRIII